VRRCLQPRSTAIQSELRHGGQPCTVQVNAFDPAFPHCGYSCLLMCLLSFPAHGETRRDVGVSIGASSRHSRRHRAVSHGQSPPPSLHAYQLHSYAHGEPRVLPMLFNLVVNSLYHRGAGHRGHRVAMIG
jgi:hypothetical protein